MNSNPENKPPVIPVGYKVIRDDKGWYVIPEKQAPDQPITPEVPI